MSQKIQTKTDGRAYPVIVCDFCNEQITDAKDGNTLWKEKLDFRKDETIKVYHTHKKCNRAFEALDPEVDSIWMSHDLPHDLFMLLLNINYNAIAAERNAQLMAEL